MTVWQRLGVVLIFFSFFFSPAPVVQRRAGGVAGVVLGGRSAAAAVAASLFSPVQDTTIFYPSTARSGREGRQRQKEGARGARGGTLHGPPPLSDIRTACGVLQVTRPGEPVSGSRKGVQEARALWRERPGLNDSLQPRALFLCLRRMAPTTGSRYLRTQPETSTPPSLSPPLRITSTVGKQRRLSRTHETRPSASHVG